MIFKQEIGSGSDSIEWCSFLKTAIPLFTFDGIMVLKI